MLAERREAFLLDVMVMFFVMILLQLLLARCILGYS